MGSERRQEYLMRAMSILLGLPSTVVGTTRIHLNAAVCGQLVHEYTASCMMVHDRKPSS